MAYPIRTIGLASLTTLSLILSGCSSSDQDSDATSVSSSAQNGGSQAASGQHALTIEDNNGEHTINQPVSKAAVTDNRAFEILANWGVKISAAPLNLVPKSLGDVYNKDTVPADLGSHREPNLEALVAAEPDLVWNGQRFSQHQKDIEKLVPDTPVVDFEPRDNKPLDEELIRHTEALGKVFEHEEESKQLIKDFQDALSRAKAAYDPSKKVMAVNTSGGKIGFIAPSVGRTFGPLFDLVGMTPALEVPGGSHNHEGDDISVEAIADANPDWILVMDRDGAINKDKEGYTPGEDLVKDNEALKKTTAVTEGNVVVAPADTYINENIITYTEILNAMADAFEGKAKKS